MRVLDLSDEPLAHGARLLADLGADVVRVEHARGDALRRRPPFLDDADGDVERGYAHLLYNGGKRSLAVDTEDPAVWAALTPLLAHVRHRARSAAVRTPRWRRGWPIATPGRARFLWSTVCFGEPARRAKMTSR